MEGLFAEKGKGLGDLKLDGDQLSRAVEKLMAQIGGEDEYLDFLQRMFANACAHIEDKKYYFVEDHFYDSLDIVFGGRTLSAFKLLLLVLEANFPDFLAQTGKGFGKKIQGILTSGQEDETSKTEPQK